MPIKKNFIGQTKEVVQGLQEGDEIGQRTITGPAVWSEKGWMFPCKCSCGELSSVRADTLKRNKAGSCIACGHKKTGAAGIKHGLTGTKLIKVHSAMKDRCYNPNNPQYKDYGGRGITMCEEWINNPKAYVDWAMANGWTPGLQTHRKENDLGYSPGNCVLLTRKEHLEAHGKVT